MKGNPKVLEVEFYPKAFIWLRPIILKCLEINTTKILPFLLSIVAQESKYDVDKGQLVRLRYYYFNHIAGKKWLGVRNWKMIMSITDKIDISKYDDSGSEVIKLISDAKLTAKEYLKGKTPIGKTK